MRKTLARQMKERGTRPFTTWRRAGGSGLPLEAGPDLGCAEPVASCACIGDTEVQSTGAASAAAPLPLLPGTVATAPFASTATQPSLVWVC
jgi:hypothetical protein